MSTAALELELRRRRGEAGDLPPSDAVRLTTEEALAYRNAGNVPDEGGRRLRLVLRIEDQTDLRRVDVKRLMYEPDYHDPPSWRREGSKPVNVVLLRAAPVREPLPDRPWWKEPEMAAMEEEWSRDGRVQGLAIPADLRGFVYKTIVSLRNAGRPVTPDTIADSVARWVRDPDAECIRAALIEANRR